MLHADVQPAASIADFLDHPVGRYMAGTTYVVWSYSPTLIGNVYFGSPDAQSLDDHRRMFDFPGHRDLRPPYDVLVDGRLLASVEAEAYAFFCQYTLRKMPEFLPRVRRLALVPPEGLLGALLTGIFHQVVAPSFEARLFREHTEALRWLDRHDTAAVAHALDECTAATVDSQLPSRLRALLVCEPNAGDKRLAFVARRLGVSERTLQRALTRTGTTFRAETLRARMDRAATLLATADAKIDAVARRVGFASTSHFCAEFRRYYGRTAAEYRRASRETLDAAAHAKASARGKLPRAATLAAGAELLLRP
jgi:AraC-like DNA-binding protein